MTNRSSLRSRLPPPEAARVRAESLWTFAKKFLLPLLPSPTCRASPGPSNFSSADLTFLLLDPTFCWGGDSSTSWHIKRCRQCFLLVSNLSFQLLESFSLFARFFVKIGIPLISSKWSLSQVDDITGADCIIKVRIVAEEKKALLR